MPRQRYSAEVRGTAVTVSRRGSQMHRADREKACGQVQNDVTQIVVTVWQQVLDPFVDPAREKSEPGRRYHDRKGGPLRRHAPTKSSPFEKRRVHESRQESVFEQVESFFRLLEPPQPNQVETGGRDEQRPLPPTRPAPPDGEEYPPRSRGEHQRDRRPQQVAIAQVLDRPADEIEGRVDEQQPKSCEDPESLFAPSHPAIIAAAVRR